jgi:hypothetical protein
VSLHQFLYPGSETYLIGFIVIIRLAIESTLFGQLLMSVENGKKSKWLFLSDNIVYFLGIQRVLSCITMTKDDDFLRCVCLMRGRCMYEDLWRKSSCGKRAVIDTKIFTRLCKYPNPPKRHVSLNQLFRIHHQVQPTLFDNFKSNPEVIPVFFVHNPYGFVNVDKLAQATFLGPIRLD